MSLSSPTHVDDSLDQAMSQSSYPTQDYPTPTTLHDSTDPHSPSDSPTGLSAQDDSARPPSRLLPPGAGYATSSPPDEVSRPALPPPPPPLPAPPASHPPFLRTDSTTSSASPALPLQFSLLPPSLASPPQPALVSPPLTPPNPRTSLPPTSLPYQRMEGPYPQPSSKGKQREEDGPRERDSMVGVGRDSILRASMELLGPQPAPHLVLQPEICVECMMRDRDMVGVDVTGEGAWARESDQDWEEAVRWDEEGSEESVRRSREVGSRESARSYVGRGKRIGKGQPLTVESLKLWTSMNPPASAHRWRTLQTFLATQIHLLELERQARASTAAERDRAGVRQSAPALLSPGNRSRSSNLLPNGLVVENINVERDGKTARARAKSRSRDDGRRDSNASLFPPPPQSNAGYSPSPAASVRSYAFGDQPWLTTQARRFSSPQLKNASHQSPSSSGKSSGFGQFARSSTDLRCLPSPRSISPGRASLGVDDRRHSVWSRFRQSASQSVLSFAPSGSMMDMHLGLSMDKHAQYAPYEAYPSMSDPVVARHVEADRERSAKRKKKKKGIKGFFSKLIGGEGKKGRPSASEPGTPRRMNYDDDADLRPPPPLSALANEPPYHLRSQSNSSLDSFPQPLTPQSYHQPSHPRANSVPLGSPSHFPPSHDPRSYPSHDSRTYPPPDLARASPADRGSILTTGSFASTRSAGVPGRNGSGSGPSGGEYLSSSPPIFSSSPPRTYASFEQVRKEKSLPPLPPEAESGGRRGEGRAASLMEEEVGGGRKSKARSKAWSIGFGAGGRRRESEEGVVVREEVLEGVKREGGLVSVRF